MRRIVILTGAGLSAESGVATFRDADGLWAQNRIEDVATPEAYARDPERVLAFYNARRAGLATVEPNAAHQALGRLQQAWPDRVSIITQNIDDLHERGGAPDVIHMHGELLSQLCARCGARDPWRDCPTRPMTRADVCAGCDSAGGLRPDIVWFGEQPYHMERIFEIFQDCDMFVSIGTSGAVYPAAGFVSVASEIGAWTVELNLEPSDGAHLFKESRHGPATEVVPAWVEETLAAMER